LFDNLSTVIPQVQAGNVRALAVATDKRLESLPGVPTFAEAGVPGFEASSWFGMLVSAGTPPEIVNKGSSRCSESVVASGCAKELRNNGRTASRRVRTGLWEILEERNREMGGRDQELGDSNDRISGTIAQIHWRQPSAIDERGT
jgi:tripartite-type tricarboxylate transporter receptor subunit TctC